MTFHLASKKLRQYLSDAIVTPLNGRDLSSW